MVLKNWEILKRTARKTFSSSMKLSGSLMGLKNQNHFDDRNFDNLKLTQKTLAYSHRLVEMNLNFWQLKMRIPLT
jgi:hypothetical protein